MSWTRLQLLVLLLTTLFAAALRLACLGDWALWIDEAHTWRDATMPWSGPDSFLESGRAEYPSTFVMVRVLLWLGLVGADPWSLRIPFAIAGIVTVPLMALCGRRLVGAWPAIAAACLLAIDPWHLFWSQSARGYALVLPFCLLAMHRAHVWLDGGRRRDLVLATVWLVVGVSFHPTAVMLGVGFVGLLLVRRYESYLRGHTRQLLIAAVVVAVCSVAVPKLIENLGLFRGFLEAKDDPSLRHFVQTTMFYFRPPLLLVAGVALLLTPRWLDRSRSQFLALMLAVPVLVLTVVSVQLVKVTARYALSVLPIMYWLVGYLAVELIRRCSERRVAGAPFAAMILASTVPVLIVVDRLRLDASYFLTQHGQRARWNEAAEFLQQRAACDGRTGVRVLTTSEPSMLYYLRRGHWYGGRQDRDAGMYVHALLAWELKGIKRVLGEDVRFHPEGAEHHLAWHRSFADPADQLFAIVVTRPTLREADSLGDLEPLLARDFELALHLPCWIGPKDESIYVYLPRT